MSSRDPAKTFDMLNRRSFFRGATLGAGSVYLAPFLNDVAAASSDKRPARVVFFVQANGVYPNEIQPEQIARPKERKSLVDRTLEGIKLGLSLEPLAPWQDRLTVIQGLSGRIARGSHGMGFAALGCWPMAKKDYGETIDAALARNLPSLYGHVGLGTSEKSSTITYNLTSAGRGKALPTLVDPLLAHQQFFAAGTTGKARKEFDLDTDLFEFLADDVRRMQVRLNATEKAKLERYLEAFENMRGRQERLAEMSDQIRRAAPTLDPKKLRLPENKKSGPSGIFDRLEAHFDIAAGTLISGLTNVLTISANAGPDRVGISCDASEVGRGNGFIPGHGIGHGGSAAGMPSSLCHALIRRTCLSKLAELIRTLESIPEGNGSMLDNTLIVYTSDAADSHHPGCQEWPFILIGDLGGRLKLGNRYLGFPDYGNPGHRTIANLYLSLLSAVGERRKQFGIADSGLGDLDQSGPLTEILV